MRKSDRTYLLVSLFLSATAVLYCCTIWFAIPLPRYYPLEHEWKWVNEKGVPSQGWYGMQAFAFLAGGVVTFVACLVLRRTRAVDRPVKPAALKALGLLTTVVLIACMAVLLHHEFAKWGIFK